MASRLITALLPLALLLAVVSANPAPRKAGGRKAGGGRKQQEGGECRPPPTPEQLMTYMQDNNCLPADFTPLQFSECEALTTPAEKLSCMATSSGISGNSGFDQAAADALIEGRTSDAQWIARQKEIVAQCASMIHEDLPVEKQGMFVLICWMQLKYGDCTKQRLVSEATAVSAENGAEVAEDVATMAQGHCLKAGLSFPEDLKQKWVACATESSVNMKVFIAAGMYYKLLAAVDNDVEIPALTAENVTAVATELEKMDAVISCYAQASGEANSDGTINYDVINASIDSASGPEALKMAAKAIVEHCQSADPAPTTIGEFYDCYIGAQPYACAALKAYGILSGKVGGKCPRGDREAQG